MDKFLGLGLTNILFLWLLFIIMTVIAKTVTAKYQIAGVSEVVAAV